MICNKCNNKLPDDSEFCQYCGSKIDVPSATTNSNDTEANDEPVAEEVVPTDIEYETVAKILASGIIEGKKAMEANRESQPHHELDDDFGLVPEKPIFTLAQMSVDGEREYLNQLYTVDGEKIKYNRRGSMGVDGINGMIDIYDTFLPSGQPYKTIYINMYGAKKSNQAPVGFVLNNETNKPKTTAKKGKTFKTKYCSRCGSIIDNESKVCTGCGKKYFKGFRFNKFSVTVIVLTLIIAILSTLCVLQPQRLERNIARLEGNAYWLEVEINTLEEQVSEKQSTINALKKTILELQEEKGKNKVKLQFFDNYAEIVGDDDTTYHKYGCSKLDRTNGFLIINTELAEAMDLVPCSKCH